MLSLSVSANLPTCLPHYSHLVPSPPTLSTKQVCYPKRTDRPLYHGLVTQCQSLGIPFLSLEELEQQCADAAAAAASTSTSTSTPVVSQQQQEQPASAGLSGVYDVVIDALFGFSFKGTPRPPFDKLLAVSSFAGVVVVVGNSR